MMGGLGNQLFQYASARALSLRLQLPLQLDTRWYEENNSRSFELNLFPVQASLAEAPALVRCPSSSDRLGQRAIRRIGRWVFPARWPVVVEEAKGHDLLDLQRPTGPGYYLVGYWQDPKLFAASWSLLAPDLEAAQLLSEEGRSILPELAQPSSISVHVRRGDYAADTKLAQIHPVQDVAYFERAIDRTRRTIPEARFFVFSDDPEWAAANLSGASIRVLGDGHRRSSVEDLVLMSACGGHIISNSTFGWWGAWLGSGQEGLVISPRRWSHPGSGVTDPSLPHWIRM